MLGTGEKIQWEHTNEGLVINCPSAKPREHTFRFKIVSNGVLINFDRE